MDAVVAGLGCQGGAIPDALYSGWGGSSAADVVAGHVGESTEWVG